MLVGWWIGCQLSAKLGKQYKKTCVDMVFEKNVEIMNREKSKS